jgi:CTP:molybdopterin cytidylyltransferase MocA
MKTDRSCLSIVLAAAEQTRTRLSVLQPVAGRSVLAHVLDALQRAGTTATAVVIGAGHASARAEVKQALKQAEIFVQNELRGTAHAVLAARNALTQLYDDVLVVFADMPLIRPNTLRRLRAAVADGADLAVLAFRADDATGFGRLIVVDGKLIAVREELDLSFAERALTLCNGRAMAFAGNKALALLDKIENANRKGEFYLTDSVAIANRMGLRVIAIEIEETEAQGITKESLSQLAHLAKVSLSISAIITADHKVAEGILIKSTSTLWAEIVRELSADWSKAYDVPPHKWEELVAGAYKQAGFDEVILTPRSGDHGRDVIATKWGVGCIKIIGSVKAYKINNLVSYDDVRALLGVLSGERDTSKGIITTTSDFPPNIMADPFIAPFLPYRLELMNGDKLQAWLKSLLAQGPD